MNANTLCSLLNLSLRRLSEAMFAYRPRYTIEIDPLIATQTHQLQDKLRPPTQLALGGAILGVVGRLVRRGGGLIGHEAVPATRRQQSLRGAT